MHSSRAQPTQLPGGALVPSQLPSGPCTSHSRFSGVTEADLADTSITLRDVQAVLLSMFSADTILIGHSLESDLLALKVPNCPGPAHSRPHARG